MSGPLRVVIGEDDVLLREGIVRLLTEAGFDVVAQAGDAADLLRKGLAHRPSVVIADVNMPPDRKTTACGRGSSYGASGPRPACWCCLSSMRSATRSI
jgi:DNA-binding NarL/FixJ family response regulator